MNRYRLRELLAEKGRREGRRILLKDVAEATGLSVQVLSNISSPSRTVVTTTANIEAICRYLGTTYSDFMIMVPELGEEESCHVDHLYPGRRQ